MKLHSYVSLLPSKNYKTFFVVSVSLCIFSTRRHHINKIPYCLTETNSQGLIIERKTNIVLSVIILFVHVEDLQIEDLSFWPGELKFIEPIRTWYFRNCCIRRAPGQGQLSLFAPFVILVVVRCYHIQ